MSDLTDDDRGRGMGIVVEYTGRKGKPQWVKPTRPVHMSVKPVTVYP